MNETSTIRCPRCGAQIERACPGKGQTLPGSPLRTCPDCGRLYYDNAFSETALSAYENAEINFPYIKILYALLPTIGTIIYLHTYLNTPTAGSLVPTIAFGVIAVFFDVMLIVDLIKAAKKSRIKKDVLTHIEGRGGEVEEELRESLERLSKKDYLDALVKCGEYVPTYFYKRIGEKPPKILRHK